MSKAAEDPTAGADDEGPPDGRCGYVFETGESISTRSEACCWRETADDGDRCRWHLDGEDAAESTFRPEHFEEVEGGVYGAVFRGASLPDDTSFAQKRFPRSDFSGTDLTGRDFSGADLSGANLRDAELRNADFSGANLRNADLTDANARGATFEDANLENSELTRTNLRNADIRNAALYEMAFSDTWINESTKLGDLCHYEREEKSIERDTRTIRHHEAAAWTYRALQQLCEENALPTRNRWFYVREKEARRKLAWETGNYRHAVKSELSRWVMEYGSNPWRVVAVSAVVITVFGALYPIVGGIQDTMSDRSAIGFFSADVPADAPVWYFTGPFLKGLYFSVVTFTTLGFGDIKPVGAWARFLATTEAVLGSVLIALLVFVLSRTVTW
ncbi:pentapeptide repeat-containing protein [Candidatus Halobonum tyrrellensis]|uniref:Ion transport 2 domain-containing protein n=1 Tax=Candidatus Halobonum tyrrellensis G22 TaxID=1324957 RepID=V4H9T4_9EURY|nr:pentapeptide repeat-containing protein [Candidatus Halobonum tyrrellensis]ESP87450.1 Ion transport 2 domain-containing protein [Candidatus Halobonum tyrrellensis G22]